MVESIRLDQLQDEIDIAENYLRNSNFFEAKSSDVRAKSFDFSPENSPPIDENIFFAQDLLDDPLNQQWHNDGLRYPNLSNDSLDEMTLSRNGDHNKLSKVVEVFPNLTENVKNPKMFTETMTFLSSDSEPTKIENTKKNQNSQFDKTYNNQQKIRSQKEISSASSKLRPRPLSATIGNRVKSDWRKTHQVNDSQQWEVMSEKRYLKSREDLLREAESNFEQEYTFKPLITAKARRLSMTGGISSTKTNNSTDNYFNTNDRCYDLSRTHFKSAQDRKQLREIAEKEKMKEMTFKPKLSKGTETILHLKKMKEQHTLSMLTGEQHHFQVSGKERGKAQVVEDVTQRLYDEAEQRALQQQWLRKQLHETNNSKYTFHPALSPATVAICESLDHRPIYERVADVQRAQSARQKELLESQKKKSEKEYTFSPAINSPYKPFLSKQDKDKGTSQNALNESTSENIPLQSSKEVDVANRLLEEGKKLQEKKLLLIKKREEVLQQEMEPCKLSKGTELLVKRNPAISASFIERQQLHNEKIKIKADYRQKEEDKKCETWFHPIVCDQSTKIIENKRNEESITEKVDRLVNESKIIEAKRQELDRKLYSKLTFTPVIDPVSKALAPSSNIHEMVCNERGKSIRTEIMKKANEELKKQCTFRPSLFDSQQQYHRDTTQSHEPDCPLFIIDKPSNNNHHLTKSIINMKDPNKMAKNIREHLLEKERRRQEELCVREIMELSTCTFQPTLPSRVPTSSFSNNVSMKSLESVKGVERFLELKDMSIRQKAELQYRQEEVFRPKNVNKTVRNPIDGSTIAQPFRLNDSSHRPSRAILELQQKEESQLTFNPKIADASRRLAIKKLVEAI